MGTVCCAPATAAFIDSARTIGPIPHPPPTILEDTVYIGLGTLLLIIILILLFA